MPQVVEELTNHSIQRVYTYGTERVSERQILDSTWSTSFYGYDGHGSVRFLTSASGTVTDTYQYDAFGNLITSAGSTPNNYLFAGEQFDAALGMYYNRARYFDQRMGRFLTMDTWVGDPQSPQSLHRYLYGPADPVNYIDPSGHDWNPLTWCLFVLQTVELASTWSVWKTTASNLGWLIHYAIGADITTRWPNTVIGRRGVEMPDITLRPPDVPAQEIYEIKPMWKFGSENEELDRYQSKFGPRGWWLLTEGMHEISLNQLITIQYSCVKTGVILYTFQATKQLQDMFFAVEVGGTGVLVLLKSAITHLGVAVEAGALTSVPVGLTGSYPAVIQPPISGAGSALEALWAA